MGNQEHVALLKQGVDVWNQWREQHPEVPPDLREADLHGADLRWAELSEVDLRGADLQQADLEAACLQGANLSFANLTGANLVDADLEQACLRDARLIRVDLRAGQWLSPCLNGADLRNADLTEAHLEGLLMEKANLQSALLIRAHMQSARLEGADLTEANLTEADLSHAHLRGSVLKKTNLTRANLREADLLMHDLRQANLSDAILPDDQVTHQQLSSVSCLTSAPLSDGSTQDVPGLPGDEEAWARALGLGFRQQMMDLALTTLHEGLEQISLQKMGEPLPLLILLIKRDGTRERLVYYSDNSYNDVVGLDGSTRELSYAIDHPPTVAACARIVEGLASGELLAYTYGFHSADFYDDQQEHTFYVHACEQEHQRGFLLSQQYLIRTETSEFTMINAVRYKGTALSLFHRRPPGLDQSLV